MIYHDFRRMIIILLASFCVLPIGCLQADDVNTLIQKLSNEDPNVKIEAAKKLGHIGDIRAVEPLIATLKDERGSVKQKPAAPPEVPAGISAPEDASIPEDEAVLEFILSVPIEDKNNIIKEVSLALKNIGPPSIKPLIASLKDKDLDVQKRMASALGKFGSPAVEPLISALLNKDRYARYGVLLALVEIGPPAVEALISALHNKDPLLQKRIIWTLGKIKDVRAVDPLLAALRDKNPIIRGEATKALGEIRDIRAVEPLISTLKDKNWDVRWKAAGALGKIKDIRSFESLIVSLKDEDPMVAGSSAWALGEFRDIRAIKPLIASLSHEGRSASEALANIGTPAVEPIIVALNSSYSETRRENAAYALSKIKDARAVEVLFAAFKEQKLSVVVGAYQFFIYRGMPNSEDVLIKALNKYGYSGMAEDFINSGNGKLVQAGHEWARKHGAIVFSVPESGDKRPTWGKDK